VPAQDGQRWFHIRRRHEQRRAAFVGHKERIKPQQLARAAHGGRDGQGGFVDFHRQLRGGGQLAQNAAEAAASGVARAVEGDAGSE